MTLRSLLACFAIFAGQAIADPQEDADYIVSQTITKEMFEGALTAQRPIIVSAIQNDLRAQGFTLPDPERFFDIFVEEFIDEFTLAMQQRTAPIYLDAFTADELANIATFYKTPTGQALLQQTPQLMAAGAALGEQAGQQAGLNAAGRVAERLEAENIDLFQDQSMMDRFLDTLR